MASAEANFPIQHIKVATTIKRFLCYTRQQQEPKKCMYVKNPNSQSEHSEQVAKKQRSTEVINEHRTKNLCVQTYNTQQHTNCKRKRREKDWNYVYDGRRSKKMRKRSFKPVSTTSMPGI